MSRELSSATSALQKTMKSQARSDGQRRPRPSPPVRITALLGAMAALIVIAIAFGGGGVRYGLANLIVQLCALGLLAIYRDAFFGFWTKAPIAVRILVAASLVLPVLHLIPLPESIWTALPGRELAANAREAVGAKGWAPASLDRARTMVALGGLIVPVTVLAIGWSVSRSSLFLLGWAAVAMGLVNVMLGVGQVLSSEPIASFYPETPMPGVLFGTFANRNSTGLFLVCALILAALLPAPRSHSLMLPARIAVCLLLLIAIVLTQSRTALALAGLPILLALIKLVLDQRASRSTERSKPRTGWLIGGSAVVIMVAITSLFAVAPGRMADTLERFDRDGDPRSYIWDDAIYSSERYWPLGAGMGTFDEVFQVDESLENMTQRRAGRAHNDYIEVAIEAGFPGLALIAAWLGLLAWLTWSARNSSHRWVAWSGSAILLAIALQSVTDYPLRNQAMLALGAMALLMLTRCAATDPSQRGENS